MTPLFRRGATLVAAAALGLGALVTTSPAATAADPAYDASPADAGAAWLTAQLTGGIVHNDQYGFDDYGLTIDVALGLAGLGGHGAEVETISDAVAAHVESYTTGADFGTTDVYAGATAKALVLAQTAGDDATSYGGVDLVSRLESLTSTDPVILGRIEDRVDPTNEFGADYANVIGQSFAAEGLAGAGSPRAADATAFLLKQQCSEGYFRLNFTKDKTAADQTCDGGKGAGDSSADTDVTALALLALQDVPGTTAAVTKAEQWLLGHQRKDGSFGGGASTEAPNANSTGLAGWALGTMGNTDAASDAAAWVRAHQATNVSDCVYYAAADTGAIAYDTAARTALQRTPIGADTQDQFRRATSQALPVLQWAPAGAGDPQALFTAEYVAARGKKPVGVVGAAPGEALCAMLGEQSVLGYASRVGEAHVPVVVPHRTAVSTVDVANAAGAFGSVEINALGAKRLPITLKKQVAVGAKQRIKVRGLAPGESVLVSVDWPSSKKGGSGEAEAGRANARGVFTTVTKVPNRPGKARVKVKGAFGDRLGHTTFTVTR
ncbi:MAG: hypothetical protein JWO76_886 [Nocardioides sp.]|nr:hypothetical protein [Nocardioidaceae bacterium]MCW2791788.1 hypothetical protein [Nocardioides sp.]